MKKQNLIHILVFAFFTISMLFITACSDLFNKDVKEKATITFSLGSSEDRAVLPVYDFENFTDFKLEGTKGGTKETLEEWNDYEDFNNASVQIDPGSWTFTLSAKKNNEKFSGTTSATVEIYQTVSLTFKLAHEQSQDKGSISVNIDYSAQSIVKDIIFILSKYDNESKTWVNNNANYEIISDNTVQNKILERTISNLDAGKYQLNCIFYSATYDPDYPDANKMGAHREVIIVESGLETELDVAVPYLLDPNVDVSDGIVTNTASAYTYPGRTLYPIMIDSSKEISATLNTGSPVTAEDRYLTVTPQSNGLKIKGQFATDSSDSSYYWKHITFRVQDITSGNMPFISVDFTLNDNEHSKEFVFPFTENGHTYKVWFSHMGGLNPDRDNSYDEWYGYNENNESNQIVQVASIGGIGNLSVTSQYVEYLNRIFYCTGLTITKPSTVEIGSNVEWSVRVEKGSRWGSGPNKEIRIPYDGPGIKFSSCRNENDLNAFTNIVRNSDQLFFNIVIHIRHDGLEYNQDIYANYGDWISDSEIDEDAQKLPVIKIESTENNHNIEFASLPIAHHVKDAQRSWDDLSNVNVPDPWYEKCKITAIDETGTVTNVNETDAEVKVRGNWTTNYDKKSLRIKFDKKQNMLGLNTANGNDGKYKNWVLLAGWKDASLLRDASGLKMFKTLFPEYYASDCKLVEVYINDVYWGVYLLAEQQETKAGRIAITEAEKNSTNTDIGYLIEFDQYYTSEASEEVFTIDYRGEIKDYYGTTLIDPQAGYTIKSDVYSTEQRDFIAGYMNKLWKLCREAAYNKKYYKFNDEFSLVEYTPAGDTDDEKCRNCISEVIDIKSLADMYIFNELICDPDLYLTSFFMNIDFAEGKDYKLRFEAPWDFDSTMGNKRHIANAQGMFAGKVQQNVNYDAATEGYANPWMVIFIKQAWFQNLVKSEWVDRKPVDAINQVSILMGFYSVDLEERLVFNRTRWGTPYENGELNADSASAAEKSQYESAIYLYDWLHDRRTNVDTLISNLTTN